MKGYMGYWKGPEYGSFSVPREWVGAARGGIHHPGSSWNPMAQGFYGAHHEGTIHSIPSLFTLSVK